MLTAQDTRHIAACLMRFQSEAHAKVVVKLEAFDTLEYKTLAMRERMFATACIETALSALDELDAEKEAEQEANTP